MKKIFLSLVVILTVVAVTATATWAYFSDVNSEYTATINTAHVTIGDVTGLNLAFSNVLPGVPQTKTIYVENGSSVAADFYMQLEPIEFTNFPDSYNFCTYGDVNKAVMIKIVETGNSVPRYEDSVCNLFSGWDGSEMPLLANDVPAGAVKEFTVTLTLSPGAGNDYEDFTNVAPITLVAVQYNADAPSSINLAEEEAVW